MPQKPVFDPTQVPVSRVDTDLAPVAQSELSPQALRARFAYPPAWQPEVMREHRLLTRAPAQAAVLLAIVMREAPTVLLTQRPLHMNTHAGQIAFAGGKCDASDADAVATALREAQEEVSLEAQHVQVLGTLPDYVTSSAFHVTPVVALVSPQITLKPNPAEVSEVFEVPLSFLMNPAHHRWHRYTAPDGREHEWLSMPYQDGTQSRFIWGATAGILRNFYRFLLA